MIDTVIDVRDVCLTYRTRRSFFRHTYHSVLRGISFVMHRGETLGIVGRNGSGKSTLLKLLAGIFRPDSGSILYLNKTVSLLGLSVGFDPQLSGRDNIVFSSMLMGCTKSEAEKRLPQIVEFSGLGEFTNEPLKTYSAGMQLRLGFSVAIHVKPDVLLIDELLGVGDVEFRKRAEEALARQMSSQTVAIVSHSGDQLKQLCNRVIWLDRGLIRMVGSPVDVIDAYEAHAFEQRNLYR